MTDQNQKKGFVLLATLFVGLPIFLYATGTVPRRTLMKEIFSIITILAFCLMLAQFFLTRTNRTLVRGYTTSTIITFHKVLGYVFLGVLLVHPFLLVVPRYYEAGIDSREAFVTIITTVQSQGVVLGICAWSLMFILGLTSLLRNRLPLSYNAWRRLHGILAVVFIIPACWHALELGRHITTSLLSTFVVLAAAGGVLPLLKTYLSRSTTHQEVSR